VEFWPKAQRSPARPSRPLALAGPGRAARSAVGMGSRPSRVKAVQGGGAETVVHAPKQDQTASAPPTPLHPDGAPRGSSKNSEAFPPPMPGQVAEAGDPSGPPRAPPRRAHTGCGSWPSQDRPQGGDPVAVATAAAWAAVEDADGPIKPVKPEIVFAAGAQNGVHCERINFSAPQEEVFALATEAFGSIASSLSSPKWNRRLEALKGVGTVLKGLDIGRARQQQQQRGQQVRDSAKCFRAACLILNIALREKVLPVLFAAHELYRIALDHGQAAVSEEEATFAISTLLEHAVAKLGEMNIRLHECACSTFVLSTGRPPRLGLAAALAVLMGHLERSPTRGQQRMRVHVGVLDVVGQLLRRFPGRHMGEGDESDSAAAWSPAEVQPFVTGGAHVDAVLGSRVQAAAAGLAVTVYTTLGKGSLDQVMVGLPVPVKELILEKIEEETGMVVDDGAPDDFEEEPVGMDDLPEGEGLDLCVTGVALRPPVHAHRAKISNTDGQEESIMDEILEDAGLVFQGGGLKVAQPKSTVVVGDGLDDDLRMLGLLEPESREPSR